MAFNIYKLWTSLKEASKRQLFFTEKPSELTEADFMEKVNAKLEANDVPAKVEACKVQWDSNFQSFDSYCVNIIDKAVNPLVCLLQFVHVGNFRT